MRRMALILAAAVTAGCCVTRVVPSERSERSVSVVDSLSCRDSTLMASIPAESASAGVRQGDTARVETSVARASSWIDGEGRIRAELRNKGESLVPVKVSIPYRVRLEKEYLVRDVTKTVEVAKPLPWWRTALMWAGAAALLIGAMIIVRKAIK